jgi:O-methyltransferase
MVAMMHRERSIKKNASIAVGVTACCILCLLSIMMSDTATTELCGGSPYLGSASEFGGSTDEGSADPSVMNHYAKNYKMEELEPIYDTWTMVGKPHQALAIESIQQLNERNIAGDIVECGVWKGGMTMGMIFANMKHNTDRHFWLFDTFEGLPQPSKMDDARSHKVWKQVQDGDESVNNIGKHRVEDGKWNYGSLPVVKSNIYYTHYPRENIHFIQGKVEDTLPVTKLPEKIALLRLDTDFHDSTKAELEYMWDRLVPGGILLVDDFCAWGGSRDAVTKFFKKMGLDAVALSKKKPCMHYVKKGDEKQV